MYASWACVSHAAGEARDEQIVEARASMRFNSRLKGGGVVSPGSGSFELNQDCGNVVSAAVEIGLVNQHGRLDFRLQFM